MLLKLVFTLLLVGCIQASQGTENNLQALPSRLPISFFIRQVASFRETEQAKLISSWLGTFPPVESVALMLSNPAIKYHSRFKLIQDSPFPLLQGCFQFTGPDQHVFWAPPISVFILEDPVLLYQTVLPVSLPRASGGDFETELEGLFVPAILSDYIIPGWRDRKTLTEDHRKVIKVLAPVIERTLPNYFEALAMALQLESDIENSSQVYSYLLDLGIDIGSLLEAAKRCPLDQISVINVLSVSCQWSLNRVIIFSNLSKVRSKPALNDILNSLNYHFFGIPGPFDILESIRISQLTTTSIKRYIIPYVPFCRSPALPSASHSHSQKLEGKRKPSTEIQNHLNIKRQKVEMEVVAESPITADPSNDPFAEMFHLDSFNYDFESILGGFESENDFSSLRLLD